jgi:aryl-phospho-beta-D-glucosidase BglC (GH1 family)
MKGFIKADNNLLKDGGGNNILLKGIAFGNNVWANPSAPPKTHHTEDSYEELSALGFNSVRFYLNYGLFESDDAPYQYREEGWDWIDWNIEKAKKYGIRLVLNMHYPQGGFQSNGNGMELWTNGENKKRLTALWTEIAKKYTDEPAIAAFDLLNEPFVPEKSNIKETFAQWQDLAQDMADSIRTVNTNHLLIIERLNAYKNLETGAADWNNNMNGSMNFFIIDDINTAYEFHIYDPFVFTHQNAGWVASNKGKFSVYPDEANGLNKEYLEKCFTKYLEFGKENNVPVYLGEFGVISYGFQENRGGDRWIKDALDICKRHNINFNYHTYHEGMFGLYMNGAHEYPDKLNTALYNAFKESNK